MGYMWGIYGVYMGSMRGIQGAFMGYIFNGVYMGKFRTELEIPGRMEDGGRTGTVKTAENKWQMDWALLSIGKRGF